MIRSWAIVNLLVDWGAGDWVWDPSRTPNISIKLAQTLEMNYVPWSLTMSLGIPKMSSVVSKDMGSKGRGTMHRNFKNLCMLTKITVLPPDSGRLVMKSVAIWDQGHWGVGRGMSLSAGRVCGNFCLGTSSVWPDEFVDVGNCVGPPVLHL